MLDCKWACASFAFNQLREIADVYYYILSNIFSGPEILLTRESPYHCNSHNSSFTKCEVPPLKNPWSLTSWCCVLSITIVSKLIFHRSTETSMASVLLT